MNTQKRVSKYEVGEIVATPHNGLCTVKKISIRYELTNKHGGDVHCAEEQLLNSVSDINEAIDTLKKHGYEIIKRL